MSVAALYDIHGNAPALEAVLAELETLDVARIVVGGDVLPGPMPVACLELLTSLDVPVDFIHGNGEREVLATLDGTPSTTLPAGVQEVLRWTGESVGGPYREILAAWPATHARTVEGAGRILFCHATPHNDVDIFTAGTPEEALLPVFAGVDAELVVCGHTHMQFDRTVGGLRVVNAGSVGMPFGEPGAYWLLLGPDVELRRTAYDLDEAARRVRGTAYPGAEDFAATNVLHPPTEEAMLALFGRADLSAKAG